MKMEMVLVMGRVMMMISMMLVTMVMTIRTISPLREEFSPVESARRKGLFFSGGFRLAAAAELLI